MLSHIGTIIDPNSITDSATNSKDSFVSENTRKGMILFLYVIKFLLAVLTCHDPLLINLI